MSACVIISVQSCQILTIQFPTYLSKPCFLLHLCSKVTRYILNFSQSAQSLFYTILHMKCRKLATMQVHLHPCPSCTVVIIIISEVAHSCLTLGDPMDCSPPGSSVHGILQERILEWVAISFSRGSSQPRDRTWVSCTVGRRFIL